MFAVQGYLLPGYQRLYWMGVTTTPQTWPQYQWTDRSMPGPNADTYSHWGQTRVQGSKKGEFAWMQEPIDNTAMCSCAAKQQAFGFPPAWGWISTQCSFEAVFMCRKAKSTAFAYNTTKGVAFIFNSSYSSQSEAEQACKDNGGHLASYKSEAEQVRQPPAEAGCS